MYQPSLREAFVAALPAMGLFTLFVLSQTALFVAVVVAGEVIR